MFANVEPPKSKPFGRLIAWDPVQQQEVVAPGARLAVERRHADDGGQPGLPGHGRRPLRRLRRHDRREALGDAPPAPASSRRPSTYLVDGKQYVSVAVGWGGVYGLAQRATERQGPGTVYTFALGGKAAAARVRRVPAWSALVAGVKYDPPHVQAGTLLYVSNCVFCHGVPGRGPRRQHPEPRLLDGRTIIEHLDKFVFNGPAVRTRHAGFHRQAERRATSRRSRPSSRARPTRSGRRSSAA